MTRIQIRRDQSNVWQARNPTLSSGELGVELDTLNIKIGNGTSDWISLPYVAGAGSVGLESGDNVSELVNDVGYLTEAEVNNILAGNYPDGNTNPGQEKYLKSGDNVSELLNNLGYLTEAVQSGDNVSELNNDAGYLTDTEVNQIITDGGYISGVDELDDIGNVSVAGATLGQFLKYNGTNWVSESVEGVVDNLVFRGTVDCTTEEAPESPVIGWYYFNTGTGPALGSWTGISLESVVDGNRIVYGADGEWHIAGNINDGGNLSLDSLSVTVEDPSGDGDLSYNNSNGVFTFTPADLTTSNVRLADGLKTDFLQLATRADVTPPANFDTQQDANVLDVAILTNHETRAPKSMTEAEASDLEVYHNTDTNLITVKGVIPSDMRRMDRLPTV